MNTFIHGKTGKILIGLKVVNLGEDTDTTGAVTGGLAGLIYGYDGIPKHWTNQLVRMVDIKNLADRLGGKVL